MEFASAQLAFAPNVSFYSCTSCVQFPLLKPAVLLENFFKQASSAALLGPPLDLNARNGLTRCLIQAVMRDSIESQFPLPSAEAIKQNPNIPVFNAAGGGTLWDLADQRKACIPVYICDYCHALYVLPSDVREAAKKVDMVVGAGGLTEKGVRDICVQAMRNAYCGLQIGKKGKAEIYCFKNFVVIACWAAEQGEGSLFCNSLLARRSSLTLRSEDSSQG